MTKAKKPTIRRRPGESRQSAEWRAFLDAIFEEKILKAKDIVRQMTDADNIRNAKEYLEGTRQRWREEWEENPDVNWLEEIADEGHGDFSDYYPASAAGEIEPSDPYYGKDVIWDGISGRMIRVYPHQAVAIDGNIFDRHKLAAVRDGIKEADERVVFVAPYGTVAVVCPTLVKESIQYANDYPDHVKTTDDDDLDLWLSDLDSFLEEKGYDAWEVEEWQRDPGGLLDYCCDDDEDERAEKAQEMQEAMELLSEMQVMLDEAVEKNEGDLGDFVITVRDGNHRAFGALLAHEPYFYMILEDNEYQDLNETDPNDARIIDALE